MNEQEFDRVRAAARELEAAINAIPDIVAEVEIERYHITSVDDARPRYVHRVTLVVRGDSVRVWP